MKLCVLALVLALGCGSSKEPSAGPDEGSARPTVTDPIGFCVRARGVILRRRKCFPEDTSLKMALAELAKMEADAPSEPTARRRAAVECAVRLDGLMRTEQPQACPLDATDDERGELASFLAAWYGERTAPPKTGDDAVDAVVTRLGEGRDAACACKDVACARAAIAELDKIVLPAETPAAARDAAARMIDEAGRCKHKLVFGPPA